MASVLKDKVTVSELSKFGFKVGNEFINYSKQLPEADKTNVVPGATFEGDFYVADSGKRYLNKILSSVPSAKGAAVSSQTTLAAPAFVDTEQAKKYAPKPFVAKFAKKDGAESTTMSKSEWQAKDRSQLIGGLSHDAAAITAALVNVTQVLKPLDLYKELLTGMIAIREELK